MFKFAKQQKSALILITMLLVINISARIYMRGKIIIFNAMNRAYEKLVVAYDTGGRDGVEKEIELMYTHTKRPLAHKFLNNIRAEINQAKDPRAFMCERISEKRKEVNRLKQILLTLNIFIITILIVRISRNLISAAKTR